MTANIPEELLSSNHRNEIHPSKYLYKNVTNKEDKDFADCLQKLQYHKCSAFCMQKRHFL